MGIFARAKAFFTEPNFVCILNHGGSPESFAPEFVNTLSGGKLKTQFDWTVTFKTGVINFKVNDGSEFNIHINKQSHTRHIDDEEVNWFWVGYLDINLSGLVSVFFN